MWFRLGPRARRVLVALLLVVVAVFCVVMVVRKGGWWWMIADVPILVLVALYYLFDAGGWKGARPRPEAHPSLGGNGE